MSKVVSGNLHFHPDYFPSVLIAFVCRDTYAIKAFLKNKQTNKTHKTHKKTSKLFSTCISKHHLQKQVIAVFIQMPSCQERLASAMEGHVLPLSYLELTIVTARYDKRRQ